MLAADSWRLTGALHIRQLRTYPLGVLRLRRSAFPTARPIVLSEFDGEKQASAERQILPERRPLFAVLVDAENARHSVLALILEEIARIGGDAPVRSCDLCALVAAVRRARDPAVSDAPPPPPRSRPAGRSDECTATFRKIASRRGGRSR